MLAHLHDTSAEVSIVHKTHSEAEHHLLDKGPHHCAVVQSKLVAECI